MEVCIVGGGNSAIISAKICLDRGLVPIILTKDPVPGGLWSGLPNQIGVWDSLHTNTSKYLFTFSDYLWSPDDPDYPSGSQFITYLNGYIQKHGLLQYFQFSSNVHEVARHGEDYIVRWKVGEELKEKVFRYVIIASGHCSKEISRLENTEEFSGILVKGGEYREPSIFTGKKVVCIGRSFTSSDIAAEATSSAEKVTQIYKKSYLIIKKYAYGLPYDFFFFPSSIIGTEVSIIHTLAANAHFAQVMFSLFGNPSSILPEWEIPENSSEFYKFVINSDSYLEAVASKKIELVKGSAKALCRNGVVLADGRQIEADVVVSATGYVADYSYLSEELKGILQYQDDNSLLSTIMYRSILHPALPRLCFVGNALAGNPGKFELPAEIGIRYLLGELNVSEEEMWQGVRDEEGIREKLGDFGSPYSYDEYLKETVRILGISIDSEFVKNELEFSKGPILPQMFWLERPGQVELAKQAIAEIKRKFPHFEFN